LENCLNDKHHRLVGRSRYIDTSAQIYYWKSWSLVRASENGRDLWSLSHTINRYNMTRWFFSSGYHVKWWVALREGSGKMVHSTDRGPLP
jgi:hypothetical protein